MVASLTETVVLTLRRLRFSNRPTEKEVQAEIAKLLRLSGLAFKREERLGPRSIVDFFVTGRMMMPGRGIVIEVKKGKPHSTAEVIRQIERYAAFDRVKGVIIVVGGKLHNPPSETSNGKPVVYIGLAKLWGVAI